MNNLLNKLLNKEINYNQIKDIDLNNFLIFLKDEISKLYNNKDNDKFIKLEKIIKIHNDIEDLQKKGALHNTIREEMEKKGYKAILNKMYYINKEAKVYRVIGDNIREIKPTNSTNNGYKINYRDGSGKQYTKQLHILVYEAFKSVTSSEIIFLDGNRKNCKLENLMSIDELVKFYNENNKKIGVYKNE